MSPKSALVIRATGSQGKATTAHLLKAGWTVHAFVADPDHPRALALKNIGASLHKGTLGDASTIEAAIKGCTAVFLNQMPSFTDDAETREAAAVIDLAKKAEVKHIVHATSLGIADPDYRTRYKDHIVAPALFGKADVEKLVQGSGIPWTILRSGYFMTNFTVPLVAYMFPELPQGKIVCSYKPDTVLPLVDPDDIGAFAAAAFEEPVRFSGKFIEIASEKESVKNVVQQISAVAGKDIETVYRTDEETQADIAKGNAFVSGQLLTLELGKLAKIEEVKAWGIPLTNFRAFLEKNKETVVP